MENIRTKQLRKIIAEVFNGSQSALAAKVGVSRSQIGQYLGGYRNIGEKVARKIEHGSGKPEGWLDSIANIENLIATNIASRRIPLISYAQAALWIEAAKAYQLEDDDEWLLTKLYLSESAFALKINGESMLPEFKDGDDVIIDPEVSPLPSDFVVAKNINNEATFKKYRSHGLNGHGEEVVELVALNPDFPSIRSDISPLQIIGTMVEHRKYRKR